jgi:glutamyl-tRNA(Gln) amidotransferase subunit D
MDQAAFLKKFALSEGDLVRVVKSGTIFEGTVIPSSDADVLVLKLKNGYNAGFDPAALSEVVRLGSEKKAAKPAQKPLPHDPALPTILILHTGGTISSRVNYATGGVFSAFSPSDLLEMFPELMQKSNFETRVVTNILSGSMRFDHYPVIAEEIKKALSQGFAGIIIPHGTDTLSFTSAAMAFMIQDPAVPILFVGAQRSSDRGSSDAAMNLSCAVDFILKGDFAGFAICWFEGFEF